MTSVGASLKYRLTAHFFSQLSACDVVAKKVLLVITQRE